MFYEIKHPLIKHKLTKIRDKNTVYKQFRELVKEITKLIAYDAMSEMELVDIDIETPLSPMTGSHLKREIVIVPIMRAGMGMLDGILDLVPSARVGFVGMYRDHDSAEPVAYYEKLPENLDDPEVYVIDPMLATGGSLDATVKLIKKYGYRRITVITVLSSPEGIEYFGEKHPDVRVYTGAVDSHLNDKKYIVPGLGDAGDRLFGTK